MQLSLTPLAVCLVLTFVGTRGQLSVDSRLQHQFNSQKNGKLTAITVNTSVVCSNCFNSTCILPSGYCFIDGLCLQDGDSLYNCLQCSSSQNQFEWTYNSACSAGDARCSYRQFIAQHLCNSSIINAFYENFQNATITLFNHKCSTLSCQAGFFSSTSVNSSSNTTQTVLFSCCPGYFCPDGQICMIPCRDAAYCPSPLTPKMGFCLTDVDCPQNAPARFNEYGCGGSSIEGFCPLQSYCPNSFTKISCQNLDSAYCPSGVIENIVCPNGFTCHNGIIDNTSIFIVAMIIVLVPLILLVVFRLIVNIGILQYIANKYKCCICCSPKDNYSRKQQYAVTPNNISDYFKALAEPYGSEDNGFNVKLEDAKLNIPKCKGFNNGFTFTIKSGQINGIMGQSGCGKTSLLYTIQGRKGLQKEGKIAFSDGSKKNAHWHPLHTWLSDLVGYVPQEDVMHSDLTVFETVYFSARSRRLKNDRETIRNDVKFVLNELDMAGKAHTITEKLSGGNYCPIDQ